MNLEQFDYKTITMSANIVMALVWIIYLHLVLIQYRRSNRPFLLIHHAHENDPGALCLFVNMSKEPVHLQCVVAYFHTTTDTIGSFITDYDRMTPDDRDVLSRLRQGPIQPGGYLVLGSFEDILAGEKLEDKPASKLPTKNYLSEINSLELCVAVTHGPSKLTIGARRHFYIEKEQGETVIRPHSIHTEQLVGFRKRKTVRKWVEIRLEPKHQGLSEKHSTDQSGRTGHIE